eukprot:PhM_4_TR5169/c2_g2_i1/m.79916
MFFRKRRLFFSFVRRLLTRPEPQTTLTLDLRHSHTFLHLSFGGGCVHVHPHRARRTDNPHDSLVVLVVRHRNIDSFALRGRTVNKRVLHLLARDALQHGGGLQQGVGRSDDVGRGGPLAERSHELEPRMLRRLLGALRPSRHIRVEQRADEILRVCGDLREVGRREAQDAVLDHVELRTEIAAPERHRAAQEKVREHADTPHLPTLRLAARRHQRPLDAAALQCPQNVRRREIEPRTRRREQALLADAQLRQTKVAQSDLQRIGALDEDVVGLHVSMHNISAVQITQRVQDLVYDQAHLHLRRAAFLFHPRDEVSVRHVLHDHGDDTFPLRVLNNFMNADDPPVHAAAQDLLLVHDSLRDAVLEEFDRAQLAGPLVPAQDHAAEGALAKLAHLVVNVSPLDAHDGSHIE